MCAGKSSGLESGKVAEMMLEQPGRVVAQSLAERAILHHLWQRLVGLWTSLAGAAWKPKAMPFIARFRVSDRQKS
jgi:hypothetical protein